MNWLSVEEDSGSVLEYFKRINLAQGKVKTGQFLNEVLMEFAKVSTRFFDNVGDFAFCYKEKQLSSIFLPSFFNLGYGAMQEVPTRRKERGIESTFAWLDYWVQKDNKWIFLIELKHDWQYLTGSITKSATGKIYESVRQLKCIRKAEIDKLSSVETTYKIALIVLPVYLTIPVSKNLDIGEIYQTPRADLEGTAERILDSIADEVSWLGIWSIPERMQLAFKSDKMKRQQCFAGVILIATVVK
jgi:hypothetical protein